MPVADGWAGNACFLHLCPQTNRQMDGQSLLERNQSATNKARYRATPVASGGQGP